MGDGDNTIRRLFGNQQGLTLVLTLMFLAVLTITGSTAVLMTSTDLLLGGNYKSSQVAFYQAEAGVHYVLARLPVPIGDGTLLLDGSQTTEDYTFGVPSGFTFQVPANETFTRVADTRKYVFQVTGRPRLNSPLQATLEVVIQRQSALPYGVFGDARVDLPTAGTVTAYIGSNGVVSVDSREALIAVDGDIALGASDTGDAAVFTFRATSETLDAATVTVPVGAGHEMALQRVARINPDPLDAAALVEEASLHLLASNNNASVAEISSYTLSQSTTLSSGDYYLDALTLGNGTTLTLDATSGDVNIYAKSLQFTHDAQLIIEATGSGKVTFYLDGEGAFGAPDAPSQPTLTMSGPASHFRVFSRSSEPLRFYHHGDFKGVIYAPFAPVTLQNSSASGLFWGNIMTFPGDAAPFTFDTDPAVHDQFLSADVALVSWTEIRN
jgi:hypothetical protein